MNKDISCLNYIMQDCFSLVTAIFRGVIAWLYIIINIIAKFTVIKGLTFNKMLQGMLLQNKPVIIKDIFLLL